MILIQRNTMSGTNIQIYFYKYKTFIAIGIDKVKIDRQLDMVTDWEKDIRLTLQSNRQFYSNINRIRSIK